MTAIVIPDVCLKAEGLHEEKFLNYSRILQLKEKQVEDEPHVLSSTHRSYL